MEEKGKSKVMDTEVDRTIIDTTIQDFAANGRSEVMLRDLHVYRRPFIAR